MSWYDRDYYRNPSPAGRRSLGFGLPKPSIVVTYLLIINVLVFVLTAILGEGRVFDAFALRSGGRYPLEVWRFITYQFLHMGVWHLVMNMLGLYFFGPPLEKHFGPKRFLFFYLLCGVVGGLAFLGLGSLMTITPRLVGASGSVLGLLAGCAVLFPGMMIILLFFPVPIRFAALLLGGIYFLKIISDNNLADACHFGGMLTAVVFLKAGPVWRKYSSDRRQSQWSALEQDEQADQAKVDDILNKVHQGGIGSLSRKEKRILQDATDRQRKRDKMRENRARRY